MAKHKKTKQQLKTTTPTQQSKKTSPTIDRFEKYVGNRGALLAILSIGLVGLMVFWQYLILDKLYLFKDIGSDTLNIFYPKFVHIADYLRDYGWPKWSFEQGMGQTILPFTIGRPFDWLLYMMGSGQLAYGIAFVELLKVLCVGGLSYLLFRKHQLSTYTATVGALLTAFSGFVILGGGWYNFSTQAVYALLMLYAFERLYQDKSWWLFPISILLVAAYSAFYLYSFGLFMLAYAALRFFGDSEGSFKGFFQLLLKMAGFGAIGVGIAAVFMVSDILQILESPRVGGEASFFAKLMSKPLLATAELKHNATAAMRLFSSDLLGTGAEFKGWRNYLEAPILYCGLLTLLLLPQVFMTLNKKQKIVYGIFLFAWVAPIVFPFFRYAFWLFAGDYYRTFSFFVVLALLLYSMKGLHEVEKNNRLSLPLLGIWLVVLFGLLFFPYFEKNSPIDTNLRGIVVALLCFYSLLIVGLSKLKAQKFYIQLILLVTVMVEVGYFSSITTTNRVVVSAKEYKARKGYNDYTKEAVAHIKSTDKGFYRVTKDYASGPAMHRSINDAKVQNYRSTPSYHSFNQKYYIRFLQEMNVIKVGDENQTRWAPGLRSRPVLESWASVKYALAKEDPKVFEQRGYTRLQTFNNVHLLRNELALPMGFGYRQYIPFSEFKKLNRSQKDAAIMKAVVIEDTQLNLFKDKLTPFNASGLSTEYSGADYQADVENLRRNPMTLTQHHENLIKGSIQINRAKLLSFSIPYDKGWTAVVNGKTVKPLLTNIGFTGLLLEPGQHTIELRFSPPYVGFGFIVSLLSILLFAGLYWFLEKKKPVVREAVEVDTTN